MRCAALWDLDGTLIDSEELHWCAWRGAMAREGVHLTREQFVVTFGKRNDAIIPEWLPGASPDDVRRIGDGKEIAYRSMVREEGLAPLPGAAQWARRLHESGWVQAVASSAPRENIDCVLEATGLAPWFDALVAAEDVRRGKPDPEVFLIAAARVGVEPSRCIVVEDAEAGIEAGRRAGMKTIGVTRGRRQLDADLTVISLDHLPDNTFSTLLHHQTDFPLSGNNA